MLNTDNTLTISIDTETSLKLAGLILWTFILLIVYKQIK
jgi:hypothetical protein